MSNYNQNRNYNNQNRNNNQNRYQNFSLTDNIGDLDPVAVVYNISNTDIENTIVTFLSQVKDIEGIDCAKVTYKKVSKSEEELRRNPVRKEEDRYKYILQGWVFISKQSPEIYSNKMDINPMFKDRLDESTFKVTQKLQSALSQICRDTSIVSDNRSEVIGVKVDIFKVLAYRLCVDPRRHELQITQTLPIDKSISLSTVYKKEKMNQQPREEKVDNKYRYIMNQK